MMWHIPEYIYIGGMVVFGAVVHALVKYRTALQDPETEYTIVDFLTLTFIAAFSGVITGLIATLFFESSIVVLVFSAIGAFWGLEGLSKLSGTLQDILINVLTKK